MIKKTYNTYKINYRGTILINHYTDIDIIWTKKVLNKSA